MSATDTRPEILHIINSFAKAPMYVQLIQQLDQFEISQKIYSAVRTKEESQYHPTEINHLPIFCHHILKKHDIIFFRHKIKKIYHDLTAHIAVKDISLTHAHTLYSDGAVALKLLKSHGIPYVISVRGGDVQDFTRRRPDLAGIRNKVLREAKRVIFISSVQQDYLSKYLRSSLKKEVLSKSVILPNGIDPYYLKSQPSEIQKKENDSPLKLLYAGSLIPQKNTLKLIEAAHLISKKRAVKLTIVGSGELESKIDAMVSSGKYPFLERMNAVKDKSKLVELYRSHDIFVMISRQETFGLVYIEALSQGVPVVYSSGEGIEGYLKGKEFGEPVKDTGNTRAIADAIETLSHRSGPELSKKCISFSRQFYWPDIARKYRQLYHEAHSVFPC